MPYPGQNPGRDLQGNPRFPCIPLPLSEGDFIRKGGVSPPANINREKG